MSNSNNAEQINPCCMSLYLIGWCFMYLCPIIGQFMGIRILLNKDKYLSHPNQSERFMARLALILCTYGVGYVLIYTIYYLCKWYYDGWKWSLSNYDNSYGKLGILGLTCGLYSIWWIGTKYIELWKFGIDNSDKCSGKFALLFASFGLYVIWFFGESYVNAWTYGIKSIKSESKYDRFFGHVTLFLVTFGLYIIYKIFQCYKFLFEKSLKLRYGENPNDNTNDICQKIGGGILLTVLTCGLYLVVQIISWYCELFSYSWKIMHDNDDIYKRCSGHILMSFITFGIYIPIRLIYQYYLGWKYGIQYFTDNEEQIRARFVLLGVSFGLYGFVQIAMWYIDAWKYGIEKRTSEDYNEKMKGHATLMIVSCLSYTLFLLGVLYCDGWKYGIELYNNETSKRANIYGGILLTCVTFGLFIIFQFIMWYVQLFKYSMQQYTYVDLSTVSTRDINKHIEFGYVKESNNDTSTNMSTNTATNNFTFSDSFKIKMQNVWGSLLLIILTGGLFLIYQLVVWYVRAFVYGLDNRKSEVLSDQIIGHIVLSLLTLLLYIPVQCAILYITMLYNNWQNTKVDRDGSITDDQMYKSHWVMTLATLGLYAVFQYFYQMYVTNAYIQYPPDHKKNKHAWNRIYFYTFGLAYPFKNINSTNTCSRYVSTVFFTVFTGGLFVIYKLTGLIWYSNTCRYILHRAGTVCNENYRRFKHWMEVHCGYPMYTTRISIMNSIAEFMVNSANYVRLHHATFSNWRISGESIKNTDPDYVVAYVQIFTPTEPILMKCFEEKTEEIVKKELVGKYINKGVEALHIIQAKLRSNYRIRFGYNPYKHDIMYTERLSLATDNGYILFDLESRACLDQYTLAKTKYNDYEESIPLIGMESETYNSQKKRYDQSHKKINYNIKLLKQLVKSNKSLDSVSVACNDVFALDRGNEIL